MPRVVVPAADELIGREVKCLNLGHVMLVDYMGGDASVSQGARVSYARESEPFDEDKDTKLINYLMAHRHTSPFELVQIKVRMKLPIFVARQWVRHRTASLNEVSGRYTQLSDDFYVPELDDIQAQSTNNKQGRMEDGSFTPEQKQWAQNKFVTEQECAYADYDRRISDGMAKELARINLPVSTYTTWIWNQSLWNMLHLLGLRMDSHAQYEIRVYANALYEIVKAVAPISLAAWEEYMYYSTKFSWTEWQLVKKMAQGALAHSDEYLEEQLGKRGVQEFKAKLAR